jgi:phosphatidylglycerol---prolipoprotein diacylglyceryl transferase
VRTTLFHIPAEIAGLPLFGIGWLLFAWIAVAAALSLWLLRRPHGSRELVGFLPVFAIVAAFIAFVLPNLVEANGLPIRGYGVMMMLATVCAVALAAYRAWQVGIDPEAIYSLAFAMFIAGILGARLFYVVEYWDQEFSPARTGSLAATFWSVINIPKGGLVVYGSVLFGVPAGVWFCRQRGLPILLIGDIIAPSMVLGQALGRVGCFLNGCCFGGVCLTSSVGMTFPAESPPYFQHQKSGWQSGVWLEERDGKVVVAYIAPSGAAESSGLKPGDEVIGINGANIASVDDARKKLTAAVHSYEIETADGRIVRWLAPNGPPRSVPIHAAQLYAAIDAGLLALVLWLFFPFRRHDGEVFALLLTVHPISRFFIEMIRSDEPKYPLTVSQFISIGLLLAGIALWIYLERQPTKKSSLTRA